MATDQDTVDLYNLVNGTSVRVMDCRWDLANVSTPDGDGAPIHDTKQDPGEEQDAVIRALKSAQR